MPTTTHHSPLTASDLLIGIDGGGTKTVAWLAPLDDPENKVVLGRGHAGPGNPRAVGFEIAQANVDAAIAAAFADAKLVRSSALAAVIALAGAGRASEQQSVAHWARQRGIATNICVTDDAQPILAAASPDNCGVALICGTGSLALGRNAGNTARAGGWGYLLGDEGSGYAIALAALRAALRSADGRGPLTRLLHRSLPALGAAAPEDLVELMYSPEMTRDRVASLAGLVFEAAPDDVVARSIVESAADDLAQLVVAVCRRLQIRPGQYPLALAGGVILNQPLLREQLQLRLETSGFRPASVCLVPEPVRGAVALARTLTS